MKMILKTKDHWAFLVNPHFFYLLLCKCIVLEFVSEMLCFLFIHLFDIVVHNVDLVHWIYHFQSLFFSLISFFFFFKKKFYLLLRWVFLVDLIWMCWLLRK